MECANRRAMSDNNTALQLIDIHKSYGSLEVLKGVSLSAADGEVISILGSSGSGKSTLLRCINLLERPSRGEILVSGEALEMRPGKDGALQATNLRQLERMRSRIGFVFQNFNLWPHKSILENIIEAPTQVLRQSRDEAIAPGGKPARSRGAARQTRRLSRQPLRWTAAADRHRSGVGHGSPGAAVR